MGNEKMNVGALIHRVMALVWLSAAVFGIVIGASGEAVLILTAVAVLHGCTALILQALPQHPSSQEKSNG